MAFLQIFFLCTFGIRAQHHAFSPDVFCKSLKRPRQTADVVAFLLQSFQEIVHRGNHLHTTGQQRIVARTFEVADGNTLLAILFPAERHAAADVLHQHLAPFCFSGIDVVAFFVGVLGGDGKRRCTTVDLWDDDAGILGAAAHGDILIEPLIMGHGHRERTEQGNVLLLHPLDECVVTQAPHRHIDNSVWFELVKHLLTFLACAGHGIDVEPAFGEHGDERVHMLTVTLHGEGNTGNQCNRLGTFMIKMMCFQVLCQFIGSLEITAVLTMVEHVLQHLNRFLVRLFTPALRRGDIS